MVRLIRDSDNAQAAKDGLMRQFKLSDIQATYILDTPLRRLTKFDRLELEDEQKRSCETEIAELTRILDDERVLQEGRLRRVGRGGQGVRDRAAHHADRR